MTRTQTWTRAGAVGLMAAGVGVAILWTATRSRVDAQTEAPATPARPGPVEVATVAATEARSRQVYHGVVRPSRRAVLAFTEAGRLQARPAAIGDAVEAGQALAALDRRGYGNAVRAARASAEELSLREAQLTRDRARAAELRRAGVTTEAQLEAVESGHARVDAMQAAARAELAESRRRRDEAVLRAPFAGVVTDVMVEPGELVSPGQPILRIAGRDGHEVVLQVHAELAGALAPGDSLELTASGLEAEDPLARRRLRGVVRSAVASATGLEGLFPVVVDVAPDPALRAGLGVEAELRGPPRAALRVPLSAILDPSGRRPFVWRVQGGLAERAWVRVGRLDEGQVEILEGLTDGDRVVLRGHLRLLPGDPVESSAGDAS